MSFARGPNGFIEYEEVSGSPEEAYNGQEGKVTRTFLCPWPDRWEFCQALLGWSEPISDSAGTRYIKRHFPFPYLEVPNREDQSHDDEVDPDRVEFEPEEIAHPWLYPDSVDSMTGIGPVEFDETTAANVYRKARVVVSYASRSYRLTDRVSIHLREGVLHPDAITNAAGYDYCSKFAASQAEAETLPYGKMVFCDGSAEVAFNGTIRKRNFQDVFMTWHQVPRNSISPLSQMRHTASFFGCVNLDAIWQYPPGTILLVGAQEIPALQVNGVWTSDFIFRFKHLNSPYPNGLIGLSEIGLDPDHPDLMLPQGHNYFPKFKDGSYSYQVLSVNGLVGPDPLRPGLGQVIYPYRDFRELFILQ